MTKKTYFNKIMHSVFIWIFPSYNVIDGGVILFENKFTAGMYHHPISSYILC